MIPTDRLLDITAGFRKMARRSQALAGLSTASADAERKNRVSGRKIAASLRDEATQKYLLPRQGR